MSGGIGTAQRQTITGGRPYVTGGHRPAPRLVTGAGPAIQLIPRSTILDLGALDSSSGCARGDARAVLETWHVHPDVIGTAQLVISELVTNAVQATQELALTVPGSVRLRLTNRGRHILIEVDDPDACEPDPQAPAVGAERGRGLLLVETLSANWGTYLRGPAGKTVWAKVTCDPAAAP
jgi:anti-sigma regulatory factor (Ser/Thr protein kinase)